MSWKDRAPGVGSNTDSLQGCLLGQRLRRCQVGFGERGPWPGPRRGGWDQALPSAGSALLPRAVGSTLSQA